ncbi:MAG TPA: HlyD family efflux transporter periplasmic adaptor subunit [Casimicrobiaceae bacterium]|nr:HlyD family efflux transporter periplasmic adaptor subunit [Casimicrobiaceae bacterium]
MADRCARAALVLAAACALVAAACGSSSDRPLQGYVEGEYVRVGAPFAGTLEKLPVQRGDQVTIGAPLFSLEQENERAARRQAEQQLHAAEARVANLRIGKRAPEVETVQEQLRQAMAARDLSAANLKRQESLFKSGFISSAALDDARTKLRSDEAHVAELRASLATMNIPAGRPDEIRAAEGDAKAAREALAMADWRLSQRAVASPAAGRVNDTYYVVGDFVPAGSPVVSLLPPANVKLRFYAPEPMLGRLKAGQTVSFTCDACGGPMNATISFIADRAEFTPPVLFSKENRAKLVFLVEARPAPEVAARLNPGQPVDVTVREQADKSGTTAR